MTMVGIAIASSPQLAILHLCKYTTRQSILARAEMLVNLSGVLAHCDGMEGIVIV